jgi:hypothetical protein
LVSRQSSTNLRPGRRASYPTGVYISAAARHTARDRPPRARPSISHRPPQLHQNHHHAPPPTPSKQATRRESS